MATVGQHLEFIVATITSAYGVQNLNVYDYEIGTLAAPVDLSVNGQDIADAWLDEVATRWSNIVSDGSFLTDVKINNLDDDDDFFDGVFTAPVGGSNTGDVLPPFTAWGFKLTRTTRQTRNGAKRIGMVAESSVAGGVNVPAILTALNDFAGWLEQPLDLIYLTDPETHIVLNPVIRGVRTPLPDVYNPVASASYRAVTTQNTRKFGRGA